MSLQTEPPDRVDMSMIAARSAGLVLSSGIAALLTGAALAQAQAQISKSSVLLTPHRAVYDMTLGQTRNGSGVTGVRGRMVYEITGSACEGYTQNMRFVTEMTTNEGQPSLTDLRSSTWEDGVASLFRFNSTQLRDQKPGETTVGDAKRDGAKGAVNVELSKPAKRTLTLRPNTYYPVQHSIALIEAARAGQTSLKADLYDGSEKGDKAYDTLARIGKKADAAALKLLPDIKGGVAIGSATAWPVSISYYDTDKEKQDATPVYELSFLFFDNGISRKLVIDYGDFNIKGEISDLTILEGSKCDVK